MLKKIFLSILSILTLSAAFGLSGMQSAKAQDLQVIDKIVAVVNDNIILKSEVDARLNEFLRGNEQVNFSEQLWFEVLESVIDNYAILEQARIDSVVVSDEQVNRAMDSRIQQLIRQVGGERQLEEAFGRSIVQIRADYRSTFREEMLVSRMREIQQQRVSITRPEVVEFFNSIPQDSLPMIPETVRLAHIVAIPPPMQEARQAARQKAGALRDSLLNHGADFEELARRHSHGPGAANGGFLPMMPMSDLVSEYSAAAAALQPGEISEVVETQFGFHVIRLNRRVGDQIETNHILIQVQEDQADEQAAITKLEAIRDSVETQGKSFFDMARRYSEDKNTAPFGGRLSNPQTGQRRLAVNEIDSDLYRTVLLLDDPGDISEPRSFTTGERDNRRRAYRIVKLIERIPEHLANLEQDYEIIENFARQQKTMQEFDKWLREIREEVYIEYRIDSPYASR